MTHLLGRAWGMEGARTTLPGDGEGGKLSEMMWVGGLPNTQGGSQHTGWAPPRSLGRQEGFETVLGYTRKPLASQDHPS